MSERQVSDHYAERLTGSGRGAVAVIRFHCAQLSASHPADTLFRSVGGKSLSECKVGKITYGDWRQEDVVVVRTSVAKWEVNCHGGPAPVQRILTDLQSAGIQNIDEKSQPVAESAHSQWRQLLLKSKTISTADLILSQPKALLDFSARINECQNTTEAVQRVSHFLSWKPLADHLVDPWIVAIVGKPNAGKSSFLNAIVGYQRSIVFDQPGTTRDLVQCDVVIGGWPVQLVDTAGIRNQSKDDIEQQGIQAARKMIQSADLCIVISDQHAGWSEEDGQLLDATQHKTVQFNTDQSAAASTKAAQPKIPVCVVHNKCDLPADISQGEQRPSLPNHIRSFEVSSTTNIGIQPVVDWISQALVPVRPTPGEPLPIVDTMNTVCADFLRDRDLEMLKSGCNSFPDIGRD